MEQSPIRIRQATSEADFDAVRALISAYATSLGIDLSFQGFDAEMAAALPGPYALPAGALLMAEEADGTVVGCVAMRPMEGTTCEMRRLYVTPAGRRHGAGRALVGEVIASAREHGYTRMRLDTLPDMAGALSLYRAAGFKQVKPYYDSPIPGMLFFQLDL